MKQLLLLLSAMALFASCNQDQAKAKALYKEAGGIHDQAMKEMADMNRVAREIKEYMKTATITPADSLKYADALSAIGNAENHMMAWMPNFHEPTEKSPTEAVQFLEEQKSEITKIQAEIQAATEVGNKALGK